jgi:two-component system sensor histidine kinase TctE
MGAVKTHSVRRALLVRLMGPLLVVTALAGASAYGVARHFSDAVLDQWLYDSAISLANRVQWSEGGVTIDLPQGAREMLEWDLVDRVFYEVVSPQGERIAGNAFLPAPTRALTTAAVPLFYDGHVHGTPVRILAIAIAPHDGRVVVVKLAETQQKRSALARQLLWISVAMAVCLAALCATLTWYGIGRGIASMEKAVRNASSLGSRARPTPIALAPDMPVEVIPLVQHINQLIEELSASHKVNERFVVNAAHQLRTPVATLRVQLESAIREGDRARRNDVMSNAVHVVAHMSRMLHQLLTLAKADERSANPSSDSRIDIDRIAREEVERRVDDAVTLGVDLGYDGPEAPVVVAGNAELVREALINLLDNALRYAVSGRHITVGVVSGSSPELYVEDRGPGIPVTERDKIGDRFYRIPGTPGDGCGLGLSIVHEIARLSGASFKLESGFAGIGLRARLIFPDLRNTHVTSSQTRHATDRRPASAGSKARDTEAAGGSCST